MPRAERSGSFPFYASDFVGDTAVRLMTPEERGGYILLLCHAWSQPNPGILPDDDRLLAALSELGDRWPICREGVARAFQIRDGKWIQKRMVRERNAQHERYKRAKKGADATNSKRNEITRSASASSDDPANANGTIVASGTRAHTPGRSDLPIFRSSDLPRDSESTPIPNGASPADAGGVGAKKSSTNDPLRREWRDSFAVHFWPAYPRKISRQEALVAWMKLCRGRSLGELEDLLADILDGVEHWKRTEFSKRPPDKIPYPATWLNSEAWRDIVDAR